MAPRPHPAFLRLVHSDSGGPSPDNRTLLQQAQESFLPSSQPNTVIFLDWSKASMEDLLDVFELSKPKLFFDIRLAPRFDLGRLTRKAFFGLLRQHNCQYVDLIGRIGTANSTDARTNPALVAAHAASFTEKLQPAHSGPLVFLHEGDAIDDDYIATLAKCLPKNAFGWQVYRPLGKGELPAPTAIARSSTNPTALGRSMIFISHATPQDNPFVFWLAARLTAAGYEVWSDITDLKGGDVFWGNIEEIIRFRAAKLLFIQSEHVRGKTGTRKEAYLALKVGEKSRLKRFVVPMRIDDTPFDETLIELIDLQSIDCRHDWLLGLKSLLALLERDRIPRSASYKANHLTDLVGRFDGGNFKVREGNEELVSNLLCLKSHPRAVNFFSCSGIQSNEMPSIAAKLKVPAFAYYSHIATTATIERFAQELDSIEVSTRPGARASIPWKDFLDAKCGDLPSWRRSDARNKTFGLLNRAWELYAQNIGVSESTLANGRPLWYYADQQLPDNKIRFADFASRNIRRQLVGYSAKRKVYWHFGIQARALYLEEQFLYSITPHVTFSADGRQLLASKSQLHSLRRSFCRSWWNDRWRDLLQGFVVTLSHGNQTLLLDAGSDLPLEVNARFLKYTSPVRLLDSTDLDQASDATDDDIEDQWDEDDDENDSLDSSDEGND